jgi:hypothetical protein
MSGLSRPSGAASDPAARTEVLLAALLSALALGVVAVSPIGPAMIPAAPLLAIPAVRVAHRWGLAAGLAVTLTLALVAAALGAAAFGPRGALGGGLVLLFAVGLPVAAALAIRRGARDSTALLGLAAAGTLGIAAATLVSPEQSRQFTREMDRAFAESVTPGTLERYRSAGMKAEEIEQARRILDAVRGFFVNVWPGLLAMFWVVGSATALYTGSRLARPAPSAQGMGFEGLRLPAFCALLFVVAGAAAVLVSGTVRLVAGNLLPPLAALYFLAGLSIICGFARRWFRVAALRIGLYLLAAYPPMCFGVTLLGLFDWYADFRRIGEGATKTS